jgi:hypothetical protein
MYDSELPHPQHKCSWTSVMGYERPSTEDSTRRSLSFNFTENDHLVQSGWYDNKYGWSVRGRNKNSVHKSELRNNLEIQNIYATGVNATACLKCTSRPLKSTENFFSSFKNNSTLLLGMSCMHCGVCRAPHYSVSGNGSCRLRDQNYAVLPRVRPRERYREISH